ncbi:uncharacterized protein LOC126835389 isoform X2 [Adelges cooleyi]|uniref:uncharacterized protein LOC126835389 isoform X2 n=1 Tax=Adelges cooleyi TaxID=133065 RepID=UPI0021803A2B|nr:uncharacterized protein LOC126835389 isoform X2 [Adelges cooleyi]
MASVSKRVSSWCLLLIMVHATVTADPSAANCADRFDMHNDKIIRTKDSIKLGAKFIDVVEQRNRFECLDVCCRTSRCDVFVFEEKSPGTCYLFECGPSDDFKCKFTTHKNYSSAVMSFRPAAELENQIKLTQNEHEHELTQLKKSSLTVFSTILPAIPALNKETEMTVPLDKHSQRTRCSRNQFECKTSGECIAIYNACDGIPQCSDGSDEAVELACPTTASINYPQTFPNKPIDASGQQINPSMPQYQWKNQPPVYSSNINYNNGKGDQPTYGANYIPPSQYGREGEGLKWSGQDVAHQNYGNNRIFTHVNGGVMPDYNQPPNNIITNNIPNRIYNTQSGTNMDRNFNHMNNMNHEFPRFNTGGKGTFQNNPDYYYEDQRAKIEQLNNIPQIDQRIVQIDEKKQRVSEKLVQKTIINDTTTQITTIDPHLHRKSEQPITAVTDIHETYFESSDDGYAIIPNGAFISLTLGIIATSLMILVISCRLRIMRNRYRKGSKQSYSHDADFLINGMYL